MKTRRALAALILTVSSILLLGVSPAHATSVIGSSYGVFLRVDFPHPPYIVEPIAPANIDGPTSNSSAGVPGNVAATGAIITTAVRDSATGNIRASAHVANATFPFGIPGYNEY